MSKGAILAVVILVGYLAFEVFALKRLGYRVEPLYRYDQFITANRAHVTCGDPQDDRRARFLRNLEAVRERAVTQLSEQNPDTADDELRQMIDVRTRERETEVYDLVQAQGCDSREVKRLLRRYKIRARLRTR